MYKVTPRDWQGMPLPIDNFNIRFRPIDKLDEPNHLAIMKLVQDNVKSEGDQVPQDLIKEIRTRHDVTEDYLNTPLDELTPWYASFKNTILTQRGITEYETFDHPVATMIVISSTNPDPVSTIMQLYNPNVPSFTVDKPYVDTNILRYYIVLHDPNKTTYEHSLSVFDKLKRTVGLHCYLLTVNSNPRDPLDDESIQETVEDNIRDIWEQSITDNYRIQSELQSFVESSNTSSFQSPMSPASSTTHSRSASISSNLSSNHNVTSTVIHGSSIQSMPIDLIDTNIPTYEETQPTPLPTNIAYGRCMTHDDVHGVKAMMREFIVQSLIPFMERNIQHWNEQVASARRGLTGRLFGASRRFFGTSTRSPTPQSVQTIPAQGLNVPTGMNTLTIYPYSAPEAQMRKLADYAFMLRDYKFAHTIYDTVRRDYATEKTYKYHAGTQEMMGICLLMTPALQNKTDVDRHFELAVQQYVGRCRSPFHATRTTVIYYELLKARKMWKEIPTALVRMTGEDSDLRSALFLEQAAHCFLRANKAMVRKYGFHLVMAGHRYGKSSQRLLAYRAYKMASFVLENNTWLIAKSHIQFALGRQAFHLGRLEDAVTYFSNVLTDSKQTPQQQIAHIREFLFIYKQYMAAVGMDPLKESLPHLALPVIEDRDIQVTLSNQQSNLQREEWAVMELELLEDNITKGYISSSKRAMARQQQDDHRVVCAVGEPATVHVELYNPLQVPISLSHLLLGCEYYTNANEKTATVDAYQVMPDCKPLENGMFGFEHYKLEKINEITLEPLEKKTINLAIVPCHEGSLQVTGLHYTLNELVHTFRPFHKKGKRLNKTKADMMSVTYAPDRSLDILVTSPMPLLDLAFHHVPETIMSGEVIQTVLEINNKGNKGLTALRLKTSHPSFICVGNPEDMDKDVYGSFEEESRLELNNELFDTSVISIPLPAKGSKEEEEESSHPHGVVVPGETTLVPLWIRGDRIGKHTFKLLFSYQSEEDNAMIAHRTLRSTLHVQVLPSLKINAFTRQSTTAVNEYILGIEIENLQTVAQFDLTQLTATSPMWRITPLSIDLSSHEDVAAKTVIPPRQTTFAYYKISRSETVDTSRPEAWTSNALGALLVNSDTKAQKPSPVSLNLSKLSFKGSDIPYTAIPLKTFALNSRMHWRQGNLESQFPNISQERYGRLFTLYNSGDIDLALYWDIPKMKRHGHHYIIGVNLGVQQNPFQGTHADLTAKTTNRTMFEATAKERTLLVNSLTRNRHLKDESPIKLMISSPDRQVHDFEKEGLLKVPISVQLRNCSWNRTSKYTLELLPWSTDPKPRNNAKTSNTFNIFPFHWTGSTVFSGVLKPEESTQIEALATFQLPGVYDINRWKLTVRTEDKDDAEVFVHQPSLPQLITTIAM
ncbi:ER-golgi trafficking TRAPP I complex 85 kDa subunit-domain-containing protein [Gilbertella persicaria]|uniref:ER-golgi trafficking TRAPP I complex 85 kDa subunit-domain-containing protein n=1 Tax=Gilbertella persicaria TaxID=101096 RepID=UPI002220BED0|nr:ER-golgi trafficking TRAPP I complex 85 kDa subunit-domain-containing protein [Gilbertella persicaria]KAI8076416.1 ER-golgi trafficking TRAPP I complex 85 kDa subunit-domain-containing protein [Gilbertella persicaria]